MTREEQINLIVDALAEAMDSKGEEIDLNVCFSAIANFVAASIVSQSEDDDALTPHKLVCIHTYAVIEQVQEMLGKPIKRLDATAEGATLQ